MGATGITGPKGGGNYIQTIYKSSGIFNTKEKIANGLNALKVTVLGGGGSTSELKRSTELVATSGGGAGGMAIKYWSASELLEDLPFTVGDPGNTTSFGINEILITATGGSQGAGGIGLGGDINVQGQNGSAGNIDVITIRGAGGSSIYGAGAPISYGSGPGTTSYGYGSGAGGVASSEDTSHPGALGTPGIIIVEEFY